MNLYINRYADDFILGFQYRNEAERFFKECKEHLNKFGLVLHPDKTRLIAFGRFSAGNQLETKRETFDFLGFKLICGRKRLSRKFHVRRLTIKKRLASMLKGIRQKLLRQRHLPL